MATRIETSPSVPSTLLRELAGFIVRPRVLAPIGLRSREAWPHATRVPESADVRVIR